MTTTPATGHPITFSAEQVIKLRRTFGAMPYGGLVSLSPGRIDTAEEVLAYLTQLRDVLEGAAARSNENERRLHALEGDVDALRRVLGTSS